ncbi:CotH kinase family protein [bacterium]|nr:CotH kinase family protein [bacterium]
MKNVIWLLVACMAGWFSSGVHAQSSFYHPDTVQEIRIYFDQPNWDHLLDSLYVAGEKDRILASLTINGEQLDSVGIRFKGFSSVSVDRTKNPFNIKLDYVHNNQDYDGIQKIKLSNVINDPSFIRESLSFEIGRKYMPASRANFANVYINDTLWGLYTNVEAVNKRFIGEHFGSNNQAFFKCNPESLDFDGENSNLGNSPGTDSTDYYPFYDKESTSGWTDLYHLIDTLNTEAGEIEKILNVDRTLWMHAFNYALVNFDSYVGYAQNYYLYRDDNRQFNPVIWDLNMSLGSYRLADASLFFDGFTIPEAKTMDPLQHYLNISVYPRPLMRNLFNDDRYRKMYLAHMRTIMAENFDNGEYYARGQVLQTLIDGPVASDTNKFYSYIDFQDNLDVTVADLIDFPGIKDLMEARSAYLSTYPGFSGAPTLANINHAPQTPAIGDDVWIIADVADADEVILAYRNGGSGLFGKITMLDDGTQNDGTAGDGTYGIKLSGIGNSVQYYLYADNDSAGRFSPERAAYEYYSFQTKIGFQDLVINEFMASNDVTAADESGDYDDWIELYNPTQYDISTAGLYLSDDPSRLDKWPMPDVTLAPDGYLIVWADEDGSQGALHANFKLSGGGETISLAYLDGTMVDSVIFGPQTTDISEARKPNGSGPFVAGDPTFFNNNDNPVSIEKEVDLHVSVFPNPAGDELRIRFEGKRPSSIRALDLQGRQLFRKQVGTGENDISLNTGNFPNGIYLIALTFEQGTVTRKFIVQR